jgi:type IV pilus assembly protein PilA
MPSSRSPLAPRSLALLAPLVIASLALGACGGKKKKRSDDDAPSSSKSGEAGEALDPVSAYTRRAKTSEAKSTLGAIARAVVAAYEREAVSDDPSAAAVHKLPPSAPRVPAEVPKGKKYQSTPADWAHPGWKEIKFEMTQPQYFSYELVVAPDGKSFEARAIGDLDGDGVTSLFAMQGKVEDGMVRLATSLRIENEME